MSLSLSLTSSMGLTRRSGEAGPFDPANLFASNEAGAWYDISDLGTLWSDTAGTTPATVDGLVRRIDDKSGNGNHLTLAGGKYLRSVGGLYYLDLDNGLGFAPASNPLTGTTQAAAVYGAKLSSAGAASQFAILANWGSSGQECFDYFAGDGGYYSDFGSTTRPSFGAFGGSTNPYVMSLQRGATSLSAHRNRTLLASNATTAGWGATPLVAASITGNLYFICAVGRSLTATELSNLEALAAEKSGVTL